ncbi:MAG: hypothetical protein Q9163_002599 [Psora crenata]
MANQTVIDKLEIQAIGKYLTTMLSNRIEDDQPAIKVLLDNRGPRKWRYFFRPDRIRSQAMACNISSAASKFSLYSFVLPYDHKKLFDTEPADYQTAWNELKHCILNMDDYARQTVPTLAPSTLSFADVCDIFNLSRVNDVPWDDLNGIAVPQYLSVNINRTLAVTSQIHQSNEVFSRIVIDQILVSAIYEEMQLQAAQNRASSQPGDPTALEMHHKMLFQRQVTYKRKTRLLSGYADCTVWYQSPKGYNLATNLIIVDAKKTHFTDSCLSQLVAYMGVVYTLRKDQNEQNPIVYGVASDGFTFRFCRIDNKGNWSQSRLLEWEIGDEGKIYSVFRALISIAASLLPSTSPINDPQQRGKAFSNPEHARRFENALRSLVILEEDDDTEIVSLSEQLRGGLVP